MSYSFHVVLYNMLFRPALSLQVTSPTGTVLEEYEIDCKPCYVLGRATNNTDIVLVCFNSCLECPCVFVN